MGDATPGQVSGGWGWGMAEQASKQFFSIASASLLPLSFVLTLLCDGLEAEISPFLPTLLFVLVFITAAESNLRQSPKNQGFKRCILWTFNIHNFCVLFRKLV